MKSFNILQVVSVAFCLSQHASLVFAGPVYDIATVPERSLGAVSVRVTARDVGDDDEEGELIEYDGPKRGDKCTGNKTFKEKFTETGKDCLRALDPDSICVSFKVPLTVTGCTVKLSKNKPEEGCPKSYDFKATVGAGVKEVFEIKGEKTGTIVCYDDKGAIVAFNL